MEIIANKAVSIPTVKSRPFESCICVMDDLGANSLIITIPECSTNDCNVV